jgi:serine protease Do
MNSMPGPWARAVVIAALLSLSASAQVSDGHRLLESQSRLAGRGVVAGVEPVIGAAQRATVRVMRDGQSVALGTIMTTDGLLVTKASEVEGSRNLGAILHDGRSLRAVLVGVDEDNDLAFLRVAATDLSAAPWSRQISTQEPGRWVAALWPAVQEEEAGDSSRWQRLGERLLGLTTPEHSTPTSTSVPQPDEAETAYGVAVGVISAPRRTIAREGGVLGIQMSQANEALGGVVIEAVQRRSGAFAAGLEPGDVITHVQGRSTSTASDLRSTVFENPPGRTVRVAFRRHGQPMEVDVVLGRREEIFPHDFFDPQRILSGDTSRRRDGFTAVLQHHIPLHPAHCGGPLLDLDGQVVGINIARVNRSETYALPIDVVLRSVDQLKAQAAGGDTP